MVEVSIGSGPRVLRALNAAAVLATLRDESPLRIADLMSRTGLTRPTVAQALALLTREGWVHAVGTSEQHVGRPAQVVAFNAGAGHVLGVDVGPHKVLAILTDLAGEIVAEKRSNTSSSGNADEVMAITKSTMNAVLRSAGVAREDLSGLAIGSPGVIDGNGSVVLAPSIPNWTAISPRAELAPSFRCHIDIDNDVNLAVLAEQRLGSHPATGTMAFVQWGTRIGAGITINGRVHRGAAAAAGEIGFLDLDESPAPPADTGPFERQVGPAAIAELVRLHWPDHSPDVETVLTAAANGDLGAGHVVDTLAARFARGVAPLLLVLNPDLLVIGGGMTAAGAAFPLAAIERHLAARTVVPTPLAVSRLGDRAVALGGVQLALDGVAERLFTAEALAAAADEGARAAGSS
ncbi:ROK family protein [Humibacter soli]